LVHRLVAKYWSFLSSEYDAFVQTVCEEGTEENIYNTCPGICLDTVYNFKYNTDTNKYEGSYVDTLPNCCGGSCNTRKLDAISCKVIADSVSVSTLFRLVLQKKYEFFNEPECREQFMNNEITGREYAYCTYNRFITLLERVRNNSVDRNPSTLLLFRRMFQIQEIHLEGNQITTIENYRKRMAAIIPSLQFGLNCSLDG